MTNVLADPRESQRFRFTRHGYADGVAELAYAFDEGPELVERITFPGAPPVPAGREAAFAAALRLLHLVAGVSYYKAGIPPSIVVEGESLDEEGASMFDALYLHGLAEFAYRNRLDLRSRIRFPSQGGKPVAAPAIGLPKRSLLPIESMNSWNF